MNNGMFVVLNYAGDINNKASIDYIGGRLVKL